MSAQDQKRREEARQALADTEASLLGRMLIPHEFYATWAECNRLGLGAEDFYEAPHQHLYRELDALRAKLGKPAAGQVQQLDGSTVYQWLIDRGTAELCGGLVYVSNLSTDIQGGRGPCGSVRHTALTIKDHAARRAALRTLDKTRAEILDTRNPLEPSLIAGARALTEVSPADSSTQTKTMARIMGAQMLSINRPSRKRRISTQIPILDWVLTGGLAPRRLAILAGRPGHGKTALALHLLRAVVTQGHPGFFLSLEMKATYEEESEPGDIAEEAIEEERGADLAARLTALESGVPLEAIEALTNPDAPYPEDRDPDEDYARISEASMRMSQWPLDIEDDSSLTWEQAEARIRRAKARNPALTIVALDYIGLLKKKRGQTAQDVLDEAADGMAALANELNVFFLCLAQLNRECETRGDKRPDPSNLRNSGKLEQAAGHVIFVQRPCKYDAWAEYEDVFWVKEAKGRHGKIREACISFDGSTQRVYGPAVPDPVRATFGTQAEQPADGELGGDEIGANW